MCAKKLTDSQLNLPHGMTKEGNANPCWTEDSGGTSDTGL